MLRSFDEVLSQKEQQQLTDALQQSADLRAIYQAHKHQQNLLKTYAEQVVPVPFLVADVMRTVNQMDTNHNTINALETHILRWFPRIAVPSLAVIALLLFNIYWLNGGFSVETILGLAELTADEAQYLVSF